MSFEAPLASLTETYSFDEYMQYQILRPTRYEKGDITKEYKTYIEDIMVKGLASIRIASKSSCIGPIENISDKTLGVSGTAQACVFWKT